MRLTTRTRILAVPAAVALGLSLFAVSLTWQVPAVHAASVTGQARELVRLMNGARAAAGKAPLAIDLFLESKAEDGAIPCPDDAAKTISGRTQDFAVYGTESHNLRLCNAATYTDSGVTFVSVMQSAWGYGSVGEILGLNGGFGTGAYLYTYKSYQTWTYATTGHMMAGWQSSSTHWGIIMGTYDRVGCGGWTSGSTYFYACEFARGGPSPSGLQGAPAASPFPGMALPTPVPTAPPAPVRTAPPAPVATPHVTPVGGGSGGGVIAPVTEATPDQTHGSTFNPSPSAAAATPTPVVEPLRVVDATATTPANRVAGLQQGGDDLMPPPGSSASIPVVRGIALVTAAGAGSLSALLALLSMFRRRRRETAV